MRRPFTPAADAPMLAAATILLVRDVAGAAGGVEVFMMKRAAAADFGGMYVFPGGKVDTLDGHAALAARCRGLDDAAASARLGLPAGGLAYYIAAIRECFEECGVLLAGGEDGRLVDPGLPAVHARFRALQRKLRDGVLTLDALCEQEGLYPATDRIVYFSHWITPEGPPRRYDTRFFIVDAAVEQQGEHDDLEAVDSEWIRPEDALAKRDAGALKMIAPTATTLRSICGHASVAALLAAVRRGEHLPEWTPEMGRQGMQRVAWG
jgi:8-oxo-dGTP pyrophosphatase MutT (NUDIX family)